MKFEVCELEAHSSNINDCHQEQFPSVQPAFMKDVRLLTAVLEETGNPFLEESQDLMVHDTRDIMTSSVGETVQNVETIGEKQYREFVEERLQAAKPLRNITTQDCSVILQLNALLPKQSKWK